MDGVTTQLRRRKKVSLVFLPLPGMGHLVAMVELAKAFILDHNCDPDHQLFVTILNIPTPEPSPHLTSYISSVSADFGDDIIFRDLPRLDPSIVPNLGSFNSVLMDFLKPHVRSIIEDILLSSPVAALIVDMFCVDMVDVAEELAVPCYSFFTTSATFLGLMLYMPMLKKDMKELQDEGGTVHLPGFSSPVQPKVVLPNQSLWFVHFDYRLTDFKGIIVNSCLELQPQKFKALEEGCYSPHQPTPPVYPVGPMLSLNLETTSNVDGQRHECLRWLDGQPPGSVVFLCFGSMGCFSSEQATEVAMGLERSGHRFLWVLRSPPSEQPHLKGVPRLLSDADLGEVLPDGYLERTKDMGMVWPRFAPQAAILAHKSVGGFVTHCGWNSVLESIWFGVPMLAWPLHSDQHLNAFEMVTEMGIAVELKIDRKTDNWVPADEIERGVRSLMETDSMEISRDVRSRTMEMSQKGRRVLMQGGSSFCSMQKLTKLLLSNNK